MKDIDKLMRATLAKRGVKLTDDKLAKLRYACEKAVNENPDSSFEYLLEATSIYLNFIIDFDRLEL